MDVLKICLFGQLRIYRGTQCLDKFPTCKARDLFCYLVLRRQRFHSRNTLAGLFCSDRTEEQARKNLRTTLWRLRSTLEPGGKPPGIYLIAENDEIRFNTDSDYWLDVEEFEANISASPFLGTLETVAEHGDGELFSRLTRAVELYQGDLLEGCYEDWCLYERERLQGMFLSALARLMIYHHSQRTYEEAILCGQRILSYDPLLEDAHRELMRLHCLAGNRGAALRQYRTCQAILVKELGIDPMQETTDLYAEICHSSETSGAGRTVHDARAPTLSRDPEHQTSESRADHPPLASQVDAALSELQLVQAGFQQLNSRFQRGVAALEMIRKKLGPKAKT